MLTSASAVSPGTIQIFSEDTAMSMVNTTPSGIFALMGENRHQTRQPYKLNSVIQCSVCDQQGPAQPEAKLPGNISTTQHSHSHLIATESETMGCSPEIRVLKKSPGGPPLALKFQMDVVETDAKHAR